MNKLLHLSGRINHKPNNGQPGAPKLPKNGTVSINDIMRLKNSLIEVLEFWRNDTTGLGPLISVNYHGIIPKSNRMRELIRVKGKTTNQTIVGAKFGENHKYHIITHFVTLDSIDEALNTLTNLECALLTLNYKELTNENMEVFLNKKNNPLFPKFSKTRLGYLIRDIYYINYFSVISTQISREYRSEQLLTFFDTGVDPYTILHKLGINAEKYDKYTWLLAPDQIDRLMSHAPFMIAMTTSNFNEFPSINQHKKKSLGLNAPVIPNPLNEPTIGVLDTLFDSSVYFSEWVDSHNLIESENIPIEPADYRHGTAVTSLIVDGPSLNPQLGDDGCGRFKVRHFGIAKAAGINTYAVMRLIEDIISTNRDIKVWNLSLGTNTEINQNSVSPVAALLDNLQTKYDIVFVVSGTNNNKEDSSYPYMGSPGDSINSIVVNSIGFGKDILSYTRKGPVLSFYSKPDISTIGGDSNDKIHVWNNNGSAKVQGTSFAAPWITRKIAYLIYIMKLPREIAKALIIDAAANWNYSGKYSEYWGFGMVPWNIQDILETRDDEIKFFIQGTCESYDNYAYNIPVPIFHNKFPYKAKATLCYYPKCSRNQGVDYTATELSLSFGRLKGGKIDPIDGNKQEEQGVYIREEDARKYFRKWDNVKHICEHWNDSVNKPKNVYESNCWGISIKAKERLDEKNGIGMQFGIVITLKDVEGKNRIETFKALCRAYDWAVNEIDIDSMAEAFELAEQEVIFES